MADIFINRLEESLNSFDTEKVQLVLVASRVVDKYYKPGDNYKKGLVEILQVRNDSTIDENIDTWVLLCSQVLLLRYFKTLDDKDTYNDIGTEISKTIEKLENLN